jgi:spore coat polysaccharide biosynthesis protein SpsF
MKIGVIILARFSSNRLPGKALMMIRNKPVLLYIIERLLTVVKEDQLVIATSEEPSDDPIAAFGKSVNVNVYRGALTDVAGRFLKAAEYFGFEYAVRINGDNIFIDTFVLSRMLSLAADGRYDFISNVKGRTFPKGMSIEIVRTTYLSQLYPTIAKSELFKEHVTLYLYEHGAGDHYYLTNDELPETAGMQLALDTPEDFERSKQIIDHFTASHVQYNLPEIFNICKKINQ